MDEPFGHQGEMAVKKPGQTVNGAKEIEHPCRWANCNHETQQQNKTDAHHCFITPMIGPDH
jgi:hypothetical protein